MDDVGSGISRRDKTPGRVGIEVEVLAGSGDVGSIDKARAVDGRSVDYVVPQNSPELSSVARDLRDLLGRSLVGGDEEGETAYSVENVSDGGVLVGVVSGIPDRNIGPVGEIGEPCQSVVGFECAVDVAWVVKNPINDIDVEVLIAGLL